MSDACRTEILMDMLAAVIPNIQDVLAVPSIPYFTSALEQAVNISKGICDDIFLKGAQKMAEYVKYSTQDSDDDDDDDNDSEKWSKKNLLDFLCGMMANGLYLLWAFFKFHHCCVQCNSGRMSEMEAAVKAATIIKNHDSKLWYAVHSLTTLPDLLTSAEAEAISHVNNS